MEFYGGKKMAVEWTEAGSSESRSYSARYADVLAEKEIEHDEEICRKKKLVYVVDELGILLELTTVEYYDPCFIENWPLPRGRQRIVKARVVETPPGTRFWPVSGFSCPVHGPYEIQAWLSGEVPMCGCCALMKLI